MIRGAKNVTIKMRRYGSQVTAAKQRIRGIIRAGGRPAGNVWISLWEQKQESNPINAWLQRGRIVDSTYSPSLMDVVTSADGSYLLDVMDPGPYYVEARPCGGTPAISSLLKVQPGEDLSCDLNLGVGGTIRGRVVGVEPKIAEQLWIVAFGHAPFRAAVPVDSRGEFQLNHLPPGKIGLKVGHEGYLDADVPRYPWSDDVWTTSAEPWNRAVVVTVKAGMDAAEIDLTYPLPGQPDRRPD
jgi:hypothetical protein